MPKWTIGCLLLLLAGAAFADNDQPSDKDEIHCLALNIYHEARGEPLQGRLAVAFVTMNRVASPHYPDTVCGVVWEKNWSSKLKRYIPQFSWTLDGRPDTPYNKKAWKDAVKLAKKVYNDSPRSNVADALFYHTVNTDPYWAAAREPVLTLGRHIFYR